MILYDYRDIIYDPCTMNRLFKNYNYDTKIKAEIPIITDLWAMYE